MLGPTCRWRCRGPKGGGAGPSHTGAAPDRLDNPLLQLLVFLLPVASVMCFLIFQGPKGKQGKAGVPGRRGIQVSDPKLLLSRPPPCPPQKPSPACVPTGPAGAARAPGRGGATGPGGCRWTRWASWEGRSSRTAGEQDLGLTDGTSI